MNSPRFASLLVALLLAGQTAFAASLSLPARWQPALTAYFSSPAPDFASVKGVLEALAKADPGVKTPRTYAAAQDLLRAEAAKLLAQPVPRGAQLSDLQAASNKFRFLNDPVIRRYLDIEQQPLVGAAAWAYNKHLWDAAGLSLEAKIAGISKAIAESRDLGAVPNAEPMPIGAGPAAVLSVERGDLGRAKTQAVVAAVDCDGVCHGGVNAALEKADPAFRKQVDAAKPLRDGQVILVKGKGRKKVGVILAVDDRLRPLNEVVLDGLKKADEEGFTSVALPVLRAGYAFGAVEKTYDQIVAETLKGVERFLSLARSSLETIKLVVKGDETLARALENGWANRQAAREKARERSLRTDLRRAVLSGKGYTLTPRPKKVLDRRAPIYASLLAPWSLEFLKDSHKPIVIGTLRDREGFGKPTPSVLNMPIKMIGGEVRVPEELAQFKEFLQKIIDHERAVNPRYDEFYAYLTVDQYAVKKGSTHRRPGVHIDGVQGARYPVKIPPEHLYSASDVLPTVFYDQAFDLSALDPAKHHVHAELERQAKEEHAWRAKPFEIAFWDSYSVHRADVAEEDLFRTFIRVEFSMKKYDSAGDTVNPLFDYDWQRVERPIPADLDDKPVKADEKDPAK